MPNELVVRVRVSGTTFTAYYEVEGDTLLLTSPDFGESSTYRFRGRTPYAVAELLLRSMAEEAVRNTDIPFFKDGGG